MQMPSRSLKSIWTDSVCGTQLFVVNVNTFDRCTFSSAYSMMSEKRRTQCDGFRRENDKLCCVVADCITRSVISENLSVPPEELVFEVGSSGKPYLANGGCYFNYSHSGEYVALAFNTHRECGVDIERIRPVDKNVILRVCNSAELEYVFEKPSANFEKIVTDENVLKRFFSVWTYKEALLKCCGTGIRNDLHSIIFDVKNCFLTEYNGYSLCCITQ